MAVGFVMQQATPSGHPALAARVVDSGNTTAEAEVFHLQTLPPAAVTALSAEVDPLAEIAASAPPPVATVADPLAGTADLPEVPLPPAEPETQMARLDAMIAPPPPDSVVIELALPATPAPAAPPVAALPDAAPAAVAAPSAPACDRDLVLTTAPPAMLHLALVADCDEDARVTVRHAGLVVSQRLSAFGTLDIALPALADDGAVEVVFTDGKVLRAAVEVPDLHRYHRVGVQWQAPDSFQLHAYEQGAAHDESGHVWAATPREPAHALRGSGGFLQLLGDSRGDWPLLAEVYTFPVDRLAAAARVRIEIEAMITDEVCGREMLAETLELRGSGVVERRDLFLEMPDCDTVGGYIVLQNILDDLKVTGN